MKFIYTLALLLFVQLTFSQPTNKLDSLDQKIEDLMAQYEAVGLAVAVVKNDSIIYSKGFGYRDLAAQLPANENTVFQIASMSKAFTAALLGVLASKNQLSLKDKPALYIPDFQFYNEKMDNLITIGDLLSHRSGIGNHGASIVLFPEKDKLKTVQRLKHLAPQGEIKNSWLYSNIGYTLAGTIAEQITHKSWDENIKTTFFTPLEMYNSFTTTEDMIQSDNFSKGYARYKGETLTVPYQNYYSFTPAGAIKSSVKDLSNWMIAWLNNGVFEEKQVIPQTHIRAASRLQNMKNDDYEQEAYLWGEGYGWRLRAWHGKYRMRHGGNTLGFSSTMDLFPFEGIGIVVLCNQKNSLLPYAISDYISRKLMDVPAFDFPFNVSDIYRSTTEALVLNKDKMPTHALASFAGSYYAAGYGEIKVVSEKDNLWAILPTYKFQLAHLNHNFFYLKGTEDFTGQFNPGFDIEFVSNWEGKITALKMHAQKEPIVFSKN